MADVHTKKQRSYNMSRIKGKNTKPEMLVRRFLHANGFRYKLHDKTLQGKPGIVLPKYKHLQVYSMVGKLTINPRFRVYFALHWHYFVQNTKPRKPVTTWC